MTQDEIINQIVEYLDQHLLGTRGGMGQEPYKGDFFKLFEEAHRGSYFDVTSSPRLTGDGLIDPITVRWTTGDDEEANRREQLMRQLLSMWNEWRYAWDRLENR